MTEVNNLNFLVKVNNIFNLLGALPADLPQDGQTLFVYLVTFSDKSSDIFFS